MPIAYALDGYPIYGYTEPDGSKVTGLDRLNGHEDADGHYHYHATKAYPYLNGGFHGEVTDRDGQVDPQPRAEPVRPSLQPLRGATIVGFTSPTPTSRRLTYEVGDRQGFVDYKLGGDGTLAQSGRTAGSEHPVFMLPNSSSAAGLRSGFNAFTTNRRHRFFSHSRHFIYIIKI